MNPAGDRRQELRREEDEEVRVILAKYGVRLDGAEKMLDSLGNATGHMLLLDSRVEDHERRFAKFETEIREVHHEIRTDVGALKIAFEGLRIKVGVWSTIGALVGAGIVTALTRVFPHT